MVKESLVAVGQTFWSCLNTSAVGNSEILFEYLILTIHSEEITVVILMIVVTHR